MQRADVVLANILTQSLLSQYILLHAGTIFFFYCIGTMYNMLLQITLDKEQVKGIFNSEYPCFLMMYCMYVSNLIPSLCATLA